MSAKRQPGRPLPRSQLAIILFHPDYTVGSGIAPDLLTPALLGAKRSRAWAKTLTAGGDFHPALRTADA